MIKGNRRDFLKISGLAGIGMAAGPMIASCGNPDAADNRFKLDHIRKQVGQQYSQQFNMCGYAAPRLDEVRIGFIGVGNRGAAAVERMSYIESVSIHALCDVREERTLEAEKRIKRPGHQPARYSGSEEGWREVCERDDIDLVYICTHWELHAPIALYAMEHGKHVAVEIPAATTVEDCWKLVATSERTKRHCVILENCCYDFFELLTLNLVRHGFFGELIHGEGAYIHDIMDSLFDREKRYDLWRLKENTRRNGNLYPTHGIGPICQAMSINRGDCMDYLVSMSSNDFMIGEAAQARIAADPSYKPYVGDNIRGNINTSIIRSKRGRTIMLQHDVTSPRPYSRIHLLSGTKGTAQKYPLPGRISSSHEGWLEAEAMKALEAQYTPPLVTKIGELAREIGGHGGMDFLMDWRLIDCLRNGLPVDMDVYDAAAWSVISPLSEWSVANGSQPIAVPDFTNGSWQTNQPVDISLTNGGNTQVTSA